MTAASTTASVPCNGRRPSTSAVFIVQLVIFVALTVLQIIHLESSVSSSSNSASGVRSAREAFAVVDSAESSSRVQSHTAGVARVPGATDVSRTYIDTGRVHSIHSNGNNGNSGNENDYDNDNDSDNNGTDDRFVHEMIKPTSFSNNSFGTCLILMDDNHYLAEWLAYHYHTLPLRRLIVAIDPRSQTDPTAILMRYHSRGLIKVTVWHEEDFMPPERIYMHHHVGEQDHTNLEYLYIERQNYFNTRCMAWMRHDGMSWVAMTDVDEYIAVNPYAAPSRRIHTSANSQRSRNDRDDKHDGHETIYRLIQNNRNVHPMIRKGCISMHRLQMGTKESTARQVQAMVPPGFDGYDFETLRFRYHAGVNNRRYNKVAKCMIDVSRVPGHWIRSEENDAHRPIKSICSLKYLRIESADSPFMAYHHAGTWEAWNFRVDFRDKRKRENYDQLAFDKAENQDDYIRTWLRGFVDEVGTELAKDLLRGAGHVPPKPNVTWMPGGFGNSTF